MENLNIKVVIGANYGDEGKGLMTDYFCRQMNAPYDRGIVVLSNGGAQRGHTVELEDGTRVVFHHFGSGTMAGYATYCPWRFVVNPAQFMKEYYELKELKKSHPQVNLKTYISSGANWSTPLDMILNQTRLMLSGVKNSCGMGIWETIQRYKTFARRHIRIPTLSSFAVSCSNEQMEFLREIVGYTNYELYQMGLSLKEVEKHFGFETKALLMRFIADCEQMNKVAWDGSGIRPFVYHPYVVFENGQGLALNGGHTEDSEYNTPSNTGVENPLGIIERCFDKSDIEVCYVTRTYFTRHGDGPLKDECDPDNIGNGIYDKTNVYNDFQGFIRYGKLGLDSLLRRVDTDFEETGARDSKNCYCKSIAFTHTNECYPDSVKKFANYGFYNAGFEKLYLSDGHTAESVKELVKPHI